MLRTIFSPGATPLAQAGFTLEDDEPTMIVHPKRGTTSGDDALRLKLPLPVVRMDGMEEEEEDGDKDVSDRYSGSDRYGA